MTLAAPALPLFVLDANIFIEAAMRYYAFDLVPKFWDELAAHGRRGRLCTIDRVAAEITGASQLTAWMAGPFSTCVRATSDSATVRKYAALMQWAQTQPFLPSAVAEFATVTVADAWLIAYAQSMGGTVITHEKPSPDCRRRVLIPNACKAVGVAYIDTFAMLRALGVRF